MPPVTCPDGHPSVSTDYCDVCGVPLAGPADWVIERHVDEAWHTVQRTGDPCPPPGPVEAVQLTTASILIGRRSHLRGITPEVDCGDDSGVSRRQTQLTTDGDRWWIEDLYSSNGTFVAPPTGPLPDVPLAPGHPRELMPGDHIYVGAWTRLVLRRHRPSD